MEGEDAQKNPGYAMLGHIHAIGYTKGLMQALVGQDGILRRIANPPIRLYPSDVSSLSSDTL